jgi:hypothetical protein
VNLECTTLFVVGNDLWNIERQIETMSDTYTATSRSIFTSPSKP